MNDPGSEPRPALFALPLVGIGAVGLLALTVGCKRPPGAAATNKAPEQPSGPVVPWRPSKPTTGGRFT